MDKELLSGFREMFTPSILIVVIPTAILGFVLSGGAYWKLLIAIPLIVLADGGANAINNYSDWEIDRVNRKRLALHANFSRLGVLSVYCITLIAIFAILVVTKANAFLWTSVGLFVLLGIFYSLFMKLKDIIVANYVAIAVAYGGLSTAIGFFSGSGSFGLFVSKTFFVIIFLVLMFFGYSITKDYADVKGDKMHGKKTLPVVIGKDASVTFQIVLISIAYAFVIVLVLLGVLGIPFAVLLIPYAFAMYSLSRIYKTDNKESHKWSLRQMQYNSIAVSILIILLAAI
jgi:4-hydroxybenzoate polyprenyltransferase